MYFIIALLAGMAAGFVRRGSLKNILLHPPSLWYLGLAGAALEMFLHFYYLLPSVALIDQIVPVIDFAGYLLILTMLTFNLDDAFTVAAAIGLSLNFIATFINGGFFPVSDQVLYAMPAGSRLVESIYLGQNAFYTLLIEGDTLFTWLCVVIPVPVLTGLAAATGTVAGLSVGDLLFLIGAGGMVVRFMMPAPAAAPKQSGVYREPEIAVPQGEELFFEDEHLAGAVYTAPAPAEEAFTGGSFAGEIYGTQIYEAQTPPAEPEPEEFTGFVPEAPVREEETGTLPAPEELPPLEEILPEEEAPVEEVPAESGEIPEEPEEVAPEPEEEFPVPAPEEEIPEEIPPAEPVRESGARDEFGFPLPLEPEPVQTHAERAGALLAPEPAVSEAAVEYTRERYRLEAQDAYSRVFEDSYRIWLRMCRAHGPERTEHPLRTGSSVMEVRVKRSGFILTSGKKKPERGSRSEEEMLSVWQKFAGENKKPRPQPAKKAEPEKRAEPAPVPEIPEEPPKKKKKRKVHIIQDS